MGKVKILLVLALVALHSCATAKPKGKVVRLDGWNEQTSAADAQDAGPSPLASQGKNSSLPLPESGEDAAVFHFTMGQAYSLDNDPQRAIESYRATLVHDPKSALVRARLAAELVKTGAYAEAKLLCEEAIQLDGAYVDSYLLLAGIQVAAKEYEGAITTYAKALKVEPKNRDALLYYGVTLSEVGRTKEGVVQLEKLVKLKDSSESNIDQGVAFYYLAKVYEQMGQSEKAKGAYEQSLKKRPGFSKAAIGLAELHLHAKNETGAYEVLEEAFRENHSSDLAERLADFYMERNDYKRAVVYLETLVEEDPGNENMKLRLSLVYWQLQWFDKARLILSGLLERFPASSEIAFYLGELELERKDFDSALAYYNRISPDFGKYDQMVSRVVYLYRQQKRYDEAENFLGDAMAKRTDITAFYPLMAALFEDQNKLKDARATLEGGLRRYPADENILYYLGFLLDRMGDKTAGLSTMEKLLQVNPDNANALNFVGYTLLEKNQQLDRAKDLLQRALTLKPEDAFVLDSYGWLLYRTGKHLEAMKHLEKANALKPEEGVITEHLADVYVALNMPQKALAAYVRAIKSGGDQEFLSRVETKMQNVQQSIADAGTTAGPAKTRRLPASR